MASHQINALDYGNIKYKNSQGVVQNVQAVYYKHSNGSTTLIWPDQYWAGDVVILDTTTSDTIDYSVSNGEPVYTKNGVVLSGLSSEHNYIITGTINRGNNKGFPPVSNCYFYHVTGSSISSTWYNGIGVQYRTNEFTGESSKYTVYRADSRLTSNDSERECQIVLGYDVPGAQTAGISFIGYGYGSTSFQNATPVILRRRRISGEIMFFDDPNDTSVSHKIFNGTSLTVGQSITVWPKVWKHDDDVYEAYVEMSDMTNVSFSSNANNVTIVDNNNGSYTITANQSSSQTIDLNFSCTVDNVLITGTLGLGIVDGIYYRIKLDNGPWLSTGNQNSINVYTLSKVNAKQSTDNTWSDESQESTYTGSISIVSGDSSILDVVSDSNGYYLKPVNTGTTTLTISISNSTWTWDTNVVNVTYNPYVVSNLADSGGVYNYTAFNENLTFNVTEVKPFVLGFSCSNALNTEDTVYVRTNSSIQGVQLTPSSSNWSNVSAISVVPTQSASGTIVYEVSLNGSTVYHTITINVNIS